jgi:hypothetical protein
VQVALQGSSASVVTTGILLLTHARRLGQPLKVVIVGDCDDAARVDGPALVSHPVLAGCGVGRVEKSANLVMMPGPATDPLAVSLTPGGISDWFCVDRNGVGIHASTRAFVRLCRNPELDALNLGRVLRRALAATGCPPEPALLDILFGAPLPPLERLSVALRAGRAMTGAQGDLFTRYIDSGVEDLPDPLPTPCTIEVLQAAEQDGSIEKLLGRVQPGIRVAIADWLVGMRRLEQAAAMDELVCGIAEVGSHLVSLPMAGMLPRLDAGSTSIALKLGPAIGAVSEEYCAIRVLMDMFKFLGGRFIEHSPFAVTVPGDPAPQGRLERWVWLCQAAVVAKDESERIWRRLVDPVQ